MSKPKSNNAKTISVALTLCLVCSVLVSAVAVGLKPAQIENARLDRNKNILVAADMYNTESDTADDVAERFKDFDVKIIDLNKGNYLDDDELKTAGIPDRNAYDASQATKNQALSEDLGDNDPAGIGRKPKYAKVYVKEDDAGKPELVVLPIQGYGLWGTIYGFLTLESDMNTIKGISFYEHKETPGLGARIEEPEWRAQWNGIHSYDDNGNVATGVTKAGNPKDNWVDGISGATLTSRGVSNMIQFWLGDQGYKPYLDMLRKESGQTLDDADTQANQSTSAAQLNTELAAALPIANGKEA
ncbi:MULTISPECIES: Na(+)-translocating NADH-quinone reductase subunit C [Psychrobacter]|jgi:Na+-transporting NADH:ubiquinone oxidoreductase subunit C|uniref:Na(+)-translocating NADH-quinone reductase subunit C n=2 Tax=Psychrobacter TaxID=497 RepID=A0A1G6YDT2_9GAMM|nr:MULTISPECIES: Na(+)-translocating NADH-quinone reductase subunit C [Psychrobacter]MED6317892.1 Na(+)-translocating NADH-quinone reductase subunit C [Pseudomonadota bacterium]HCI31422.1 Na(+)-translocating NADH-quinone reductase subunit C [Psychrobacter sp.]MDH4903581.1 Na(+)-translocating NADH-quinone reductase subunit C [Psychrobacter pocilloporae]SDD88530.1 Na+-transporting NADH:ubiquinone oxidoreductase subunit C [Psychrobacter pacificensis]GLR28007.1 Na(+)-translocating NADH-quinone red|tara:strand:+ start:13770 stop:14672 length:903 start_codon:yes stop_codon:yes gene_type:complete